MPVFNVTDREVLNEVQIDLLEAPNNGASMTSPLWTIAEVIQYANDRHAQLLRETGMVVTTKEVGSQAGAHRYEVDDQTIAVRRIAWKDGFTGTITPLSRSDSWEADHAAGSWGVDRALRPQIYTEENLPSGQFQVIPAPVRSGLFHLIAVTIDQLLSNTGQKVSVPDEWVPSLIWGILADCLKKTGPAQDLGRATYCEERFREGIVLGRLYLDHPLD